MNFKIALFALCLMSFTHQAMGLDSSDFEIPELSPYFHDQSLARQVLAYGKRASLESQTRKFTVLVFNDFDRACSGILVHPRVVMTSAHCMYDPDAQPQLVPTSSFQIRFGIDEKDPAVHWTSSKDFLASPFFEFIAEDQQNQRTVNPRQDPNVKVDWERQRREAETVSQFSLTQEYTHGDSAIADMRAMDFGLIFLDKEVQAPYHPVRMIPEGELISLRDELYVAGFGIPSLDRSQKALDQHYSNASLGFTKYLFIGRHVRQIGNHKQTIGLMSFPATDEFICGGDSGGPVLKMIDGELRLVAMISYSFLDCVGKSYSVFVPGLSGWIEKQMRTRGILGSLSL